VRKGKVETGKVGKRGNVRKVRLELNGRIGKREMKGRRWRVVDQSVLFKLSTKQTTEEIIM